MIDLARPSLNLIEYERSPFRLHILCLQSIINAYRVQHKPQTEVKLIPKKEKKMKEPEIQWVDAPKPVMADINT